MSRDIRRERTASRAGRWLPNLWYCTLSLRSSAAAGLATAGPTSTACSACWRRTFRNNNGTCNGRIGELKTCQILARRCSSGCGAEEHKSDAAYHGGLLETWTNAG